ncbi:MAG: phage tail assembly chaperone [Myxococcota bacterium]
MSENGNGGYLSLDAIKRAPDINFRDVPVPEWGGTVRIRSLTASDRAKFDAKLLTVRQQMRIGQSVDDQELSIEHHAHQARVLLVTLSLCDENGSRIFTDEQTEIVGAKGSAAIARIYEAASELNGMSAKAKAALQGESEGADATA